jgi:hypothetical protein
MPVLWNRRGRGKTAPGRAKQPREVQNGPYEEEIHDGKAGYRSGGLYSVDLSKALEALSYFGPSLPKLKLDVLS